MADTHVVLMKLKGNPEFIDTLATRINEDCGGNGGRLLSLNFTLGAYDAVVILEMPSALMPTFALSAGWDFASEVIVMLAFDPEEAQAGLHRWSPAPNSGHMGPKLSAPE